MAVPTHLELINPLLASFRKQRGAIPISVQEKAVTQYLHLSPDDSAELHTDTRTKLNYRLAWARNYLKRLGLIEAVEKGVWKLTEKGERTTTVSEAELKDIGRVLSDTTAEGTGVESEEIDSQIIEPFDPTLIRVESKPATLGQLISRIEHEEIDLAPDFQRKAGIWNDGAQSRLIESILVRIPIPAFYFDAADEDKWVVVDGLQRLTTLKRFVVQKELVLRGMEFLKSMEGKTFDQIPRPLQRRISEAGVTVFLIEKNTPPNVKFNIFKRINTGGLPLSAQEIRHALNQGRVTKLLAELAASFEFLQATSFAIRDERMADRECVLRFLAFATSQPSEYRAADFDGFLSEKMSQLNTLDESATDFLRQQFLTAMAAAHEIFGRDAFRKSSKLYGKRMPINKALFETWAVTLGRLSIGQIGQLIRMRSAIEKLFTSLCTVPEFSNAISQGTGDPVKVRRRFKYIEELVETALEI